MAIDFLSWNRHVLNNWGDLSPHQTQTGQKNSKLFSKCFAHTYEIKGALYVIEY